MYRRATIDGTLAELAGYKSAYTAVATELAGYKAAYGAVATELAALKVEDPKKSEKEAGPSEEDDFSQLSDSELYNGYKSYGEMFVRRWTNFHLFPKFGAEVAKNISSKHPYAARSTRAGEATEIARKLQKEGVYRLGQFLDPPSADDVVNYCLRIPCLAGHIPNASTDKNLRYVGQGAERYFAGCYRMSEIVNAPKLLKVALDPFLMDIGAAYLGCIPTLTWLQTWWSFPNPEIQLAGSSATHFHRDPNDYRMFWVYMYLTDTSLDNGAHFIIRRSDDRNALAEELAYAKEQHPHLRDLIEQWPAERMLQTNGYDIPDSLKEEGLQRLIEPVIGSKGELFLSTGINFHKILPATKGRRLMFAARFQLHGGPEIGMLDDIEQIPGRIASKEVGNDEQLQYITRCIFNWN
ncbi:MAG: hypothetical protein ACREX4_03515 [Gammaproteobacteria bacterium]